MPKITHNKYFGILTTSCFEMIRSLTHKSIDSPFKEEQIKLRKTLSRVSAMMEDDFLMNDELKKKNKFIHRFIRAIAYGILFIIPYLIALLFQTTPELLNNAMDVKMNSHDINLSNDDKNKVFLSQEMQRWSVLLICAWGCYYFVYGILTIVPFIIFEILKIADSNAGHLSQTLMYIKGLKKRLLFLFTSICLAAVCDFLWGVSGVTTRLPTDKVLPSYIYTISGLFKTLIFYMTLLLLKKLLIITLYSKLRERTYKDRILFSKKAVAVIEHIRLDLGKKIHAEKFKTEARLHFKEDFEFYDYENLFDKLAIEHAKEIYYGLVKHKHTLTPQDFRSHFENEEETMEAFLLLAGDDKIELTGKALKESVIAIYRERRRLNDNIRDMNGSISKLEGIFNFFSFLFSILFAVAYFDSTFLRASLPIFSSMLALSFLFAESAKELFTNCIFLFNIHPFDSQDIIVFRDCNYKVLEVSLYYTIFE